jgi:hypothetical protein
MVQSLSECHAGLVIKIPQTVPREEFLDHMTFRTNRRPLFTELFGPLVGVKEEWAAQGATPRELDFSAFPYQVHQEGHLPVNCGWLGGQTPAVLEETAEYVIGRDRYGRRVKLIKASSSLPLPLDYPVKNMDDWQKLKVRYAFSPERFGEGWDQLAHRYRSAGQVVTVSVPGGFDEPRQLLGEEELCVSYYTQPELIHDILTTIGDMVFRVLDRVTAAVPVDMLYLHEDLAGKSGPLAGPKQFAEYIVPYYRRIWEMLADRGARLFGVDSDGDINAVIPAFLDGGVNLLFPMEPAANMDMVRVRQEYGTRLAMMGGIDKHVLRREPEEITAELEYKLPPMIKSGGCVLGLDHRIPNGTPVANYRFYIKKAWEIIARETAGN